MVAEKIAATVARYQIDCAFERTGELTVAKNALGHAATLARAGADAATAGLLLRQLDLLSVDGPPAYTKDIRYARYPAVHLHFHNAGVGGDR